MATATRKRSRASSVTPDTVNQAIAYLEDLPEKTKEDLSLKESVVQMQDQIKAALAKGYSYDDIAKMLSDKGIKISALTLKNYVPSGKRQANKTKTKRPRKSSGDAPASTESETKATSTETPAESKPTRGRRGRTKSVAAEASPETTTRAKATRTRKATTKSETKAPTNGRRRKAKS